MTSNESSERRKGEGFRQKVLLAVLDKGVLALVAAAVAFFFSQQLNRTQAIHNYQEQMFNERRSVYEQLLIKARVARDHVLWAYPTSEKSEPYQFTGRNWQGRLDRVVVRITGGSSPAGGSWWSPGEVTAAVRSLQDLDAFRKSNNLLLSRAVDEAIDVFLDQLSKDLEILLDRELAREKDTPVPDAESPPSAAEAYRHLLSTVRNSLKIDEMVVG
jgi:hypothetical protein